MCVLLCVCVYMCVCVATLVYFYIRVTLFLQKLFIRVCSSIHTIVECYSNLSCQSVAPNISLTCVLLYTCVCYCIRVCVTVYVCVLLYTCTMYTVHCTSNYYIPHTSYTGTVETESLEYAYRKWSPGNENHVTKVVFKDSEHSRIMSDERLVSYIRLINNGDA